MPASNKTKTSLSSGFQIPVVGLGTSFSTTSLDPDQEEVVNAVEIALQAGYRHIDCDPVYETEAAVGRGIKASGVPREEIFITSKLWNTEHDPKDVGPALDKTLKDLGTDYVDLYLIHWPYSWEKQEPYTFYPKDGNGNMIEKAVPLASTWAAMETLVATGKARTIGISNFNQALLEEIFPTAKIIPAVNQLQVHPYRQRKELRAWYLSKNIHITAWGPLTVDRAKQLNVTGDPALVKIAQSINITPPQLALSWAVQRGFSVIPSSLKEERLRSNFEIIELSNEVLEQVDELEG